MSSFFFIHISHSTLLQKLGIDQDLNRLCTLFNREVRMCFLTISRILDSILISLDYSQTLQNHFRHIQYHKKSNNSAAGCLVSTKVLVATYCVSLYSLHCSLSTGNCATTTLCRSINTLGAIPVLFSPGSRDSLVFEDIPNGRCWRFETLQNCFRIIQDIRPINFVRPGSLVDLNVILSVKDQ